MTTPSDPQQGQQRPGQQWQGQQPPPNYGPPPGYQAGPPPGYQAGPPPGYQAGPPPAGPGQPTFSNFMPPGVGGVPLPAQPPPSVQMAFKLWIALAVINVLGNVISYAYYVTAFSGYGYAGAGIGSVIVSIILLAVFIYLVLQMRAGRSWAQITLTVLGGIDALANVIGIFGSIALIAFSAGIGLITLLIEIVVVALIVGAIVFMFKPDAKAYFAAMSRR